MSKDNVPICPQCGLNNTSRLYGSKYTCNRCKIDFVYEKESDWSLDERYDVVESNDTSVTDHIYKYSRFSWIMAFLWLFGMATLYAFVILFAHPDRFIALKNLMDHWGDSVAGFFKAHPDYFLLLIWSFLWVSWLLGIVGSIANRDYFFTPPYSPKMQMIVWNWRTGARIVTFVYGLMSLGVVALIVFMKYYSH